jgi:hypothetical protein
MAEAVLGGWRVWAVMVWDREGSTFMRAKTEPPWEYWGSTIEGKYS